MKTCGYVLSFLALIFLFSEVSAQNQSRGVKWTGTISLVEQTNWPEAGNTRERFVEASFTEAIPTMGQTGLIDPTAVYFTDDKGTGTVRFVNDTPKLGKTSCSATGETKLLEVIIDRARGVYTISAIGPANCSGQSVSYIP